MPTISAFYGIVIAMFYNDLDPPHFHARYAGSRARFAIDTCELIDGDLPIRAQRLIREWSALHRTELAEDWQRAQALLPLHPIDPLP